MEVSMSAEQNDACYEDEFDDVIPSSAGDIGLAAAAIKTAAEGLESPQRKQSVVDLRVLASRLLGVARYRGDLALGRSLRTTLAKLDRKILELNPAH